MNRFQLTVIFVLILHLLSCDKNGKNGFGYFAGKWTITDFISLESASYPKNNGFNPIIEFKNDATFNLKLDVNNCFGDFIQTDGNAISFSAAGCTEICCDSKFSQKFCLMLPQVKTYQIEKNTLKLVVPGWGWINLESND